eukprot:CAMPEP_0184430182 /NCGR_PEP_ID=MMETSP0738-20130409/266114_1 /TAXON_ID=385413 /ORGANISM="Thalassiosira miniscula, Strain CCMP1093" /LENGTH=60 /DNA_ID=CAMNT_0026794679 /DNA_START=63 /DNA_END=245 /DNA_ORIENTATION=-
MTCYTCSKEQQLEELGLAPVHALGNESYSYLATGRRTWHPGYYAGVHMIPGPTLEKNLSS